MPPFEPVTLSCRDDQGNAENVVLDGPGGTVRVVVGEPGRQSGVWRVWANPNKSDVYVGVRALLGQQKWSLHESGEWRHQWIDREKAAEFGNTDNRVIDLWQQPEEVGDTGWTRGFAIRVRSQDLVVVANPEKVPAAAVWIPPPPDGHLVAVHVVIARPDLGEVALAPQLRPFGGFTLFDGRVVLLVAGIERVTDEHNELIENSLAQLKRLAAENGVDLAAAGDVRGAISGNNSEGERLAWDVALPRPSAT